MTDNPWILYLLFPLAAYVLGSTPVGFLVARSRGVDIRKAGSGNVGATNVGRVLGRKWGVFCFALDVLKGALPVLLVGLVVRADGVPSPTSQGAWLAVGLGAILGHVFSFWLGFRGGKGVATSLGVVLGIWPYFTLAGLAAFGLWICVVLIWRYVSLGSMVAAVSFVPLVVLLNLSVWRQLWPLLGFASAMALLIVVRHRSNLVRLIRGGENRIGQSKKAAAPEGTEAST
ncbi:MAG: glycerol-3-phosphate 1-O-acyltransferase PlsY [Phycisphaerae bacterium]